MCITYDRFFSLASTFLKLAIRLDQALINRDVYRRRRIGRQVAMEPGSRTEGREDSVAATTLIRLGVAPPSPLSPKKKS